MKGGLLSPLFLCFLFLGDRARYPFKLRGKPLVTIPIVVAFFFNKLQPFVFFASYYTEKIILYFCSVEK